MLYGRSQRPRAKLFALVIVFAAAVILIIRAFTGGGHHAVAHEEPEISAVVFQARPELVATEVPASGTVRPIEEAAIAPRIMSTVERVYVREGDRVRRGQVLISLEARDLQAQLRQAEASASAASAAATRAATAVDLQRAETSTRIASAEAALRAARERLSLAKEGARTQERAQARLAVSQAEAHFRNAEAEFQRISRLFEQGVVPRQRFDAAQTAYDVAKAQLESAKQQADLVEEGTRRQEIRAAEEQVKQAEEALRLAQAARVQDRMSERNAQAAASQASQARAAVEAARTQLGYASIRSPIDGIVTARVVDPGDTVSPGVPVLWVQDDSLFRLEATVPGSAADVVKLGSRIRLELGSDRRESVGTVSVVSPAGDPASRKFLVKVDLRPESGARSGEFGRIYVPVSRSQAILIPKRAVRHDGALTVVFVVGKNSRATMRPVKLGREIGDRIEVLSGLSPGDKVIVRSTGVLSDGVRVRIGRV